MDLKQFLAEREMRVADFQKAIGVKSRNTVYRYLRKEQAPEPPIARRIVEVTGGAVTLDDLYGVSPAAAVEA